MYLTAHTSIPSSPSESSSVTTVAGVALGLLRCSEVEVGWVDTGCRENPRLDIGSCSSGISSLLYADECERPDFADPYPDNVDESPDTADPYPDNVDESPDTADPYPDDVDESPDLVDPLYPDDDDADDKCE